jgi:hypothetical protein
MSVEQGRQCCNDGVEMDKMEANKLRDGVSGRMFLPKWGIEM